MSPSFSMLGQGQQRPLARDQSIRGNLGRSGGAGSTAFWHVKT
ncbi:hypothetical protein Z947_1793 [Sulfitobacter geojensis]|nr:hypothetical protein Z947_1793 [Sulfitobacter geojensis]